MSRALTLPDSPPAFSRKLHAKGMLDAILEMTFSGKAPAGEPVKTAPEGMGPGLQVFDYATNPMDVWARIWVLRESLRLQGTKFGCGIGQC